MITQHYTIHIDATREKVWDTMLGADTYREWTEPFMAGSYYEGTWEEGSEIRFLAPHDTGDAQGMVSRVKQSRKPEIVSLEHFGIVARDVVDTESELAKRWVPSTETYTFTETDGGTDVNVDVDVAEEHVEEFARSWPEALQRLKTIAERTS